MGSDLYAFRRSTVNSAHATSHAAGRRTSSVSSDGHAVEQNGAALTRAAHDDVEAQGNDTGEHLPKISGDGDLLNRVSNLSVLDPEARGTARVVAGYLIHAHAHQLGYQQPAIELAQQLLEALAGVGENQVVIAARIAGRAHVELACGVAAEKITLEDTVAHNASPCRRHTFVVER